MIGFFATLKYFFDLNLKIETVFGLIRSPGLKFIRKKIKNTIIEGFSPENLLNILGGRDSSVYYSSQDMIEQLIGIEIRFKNDIELSKETILLDIIRAVGNEKRKIFNN